MSQNPRIFALIVAAGTGTRAGGNVAKQYVPIASKPLLRHSAEALANHPAITAVQVVINPSHHAEYDAAIAGLKLLPVVVGGLTRSDSVRSGLDALAEHHPDYVLVHDAARPFLSARMIDALIQELMPDQAVVPALPVVDTVRRVAMGQWSEVPREGLMRIQTPQAFPYQLLKNTLAGETIPATDEAAVWLDAGLKLVYVTGDERLRKVTTADDIQWAHAHASTRRVAVGMGYDVHALVPAGANKTIRLGGLDIAHLHKLHGHSDADVVLHAIVDALLGSVGAGDIGSHFPPTDPQWKGADSAMFVEEARAQVAQRGGVITHLDVTVICEAPKLTPHREAMRANIAKLLQLPIERISVKATTTEKLGFIGREEGIAAQAVATVSLPEAS